MLAYFCTRISFLFHLQSHFQRHSAQMLKTRNGTQNVESTTRATPLKKMNSNQTRQPRETKERQHRSVNMTPVMTKTLGQPQNPPTKKPVPNALNDTMMTTVVVFTPIRNIPRIHLVEENPPQAGYRKSRATRQRPRPTGKVKGCLMRTALPGRVPLSLQCLPNPTQTNSMTSNVHRAVTYLDLNQTKK